MSSNRRDFVLQTPAGVLGLLEALTQSGSAATTPGLTAADKAAMEFWVYGMGLPPSALPGGLDLFGGESRGASTQAGPSGGIQREPLFLYCDTQSLVPMDQFDDGKLLDSGDAQVDFQMQRLRLNATDQAQYQKYTSGAIYFEVQQQNRALTSAQPGMAQDVIQMASTVFSAFSPGSAKPGGAKASHAPAASAAKKGKSGGGVKTAALAALPGVPIALQTAAQAQSLPLPNGAGKAAFTAFVKDPRTSVFGSLLKALAGQADGASPMYTQLLTIGMVAIPALASIQKVISNLQLQGSNQAPIIQGKNSDIAATKAAIEGLSNPLKLVSGDYIVVPQDHGPLIKPQLNNYKLYNGFLVPKTAQALDVTEDMVQNALPGVSYLTLGVKIQKTKFTPAVNAPVGS